VSGEYISDSERVGLLELKLAAVQVIESAIKFGPDSVCYKCHEYIFTLNNSCETCGIWKLKEILNRLWPDTISTPPPADEGSKE